jgi:hypothetical protein
MLRRKPSRVAGRISRSNDPGVGKLLLATLVLVTLIVGGGMLYYKSRNPATNVDAISLCPLSVPSSAVLGILLDVSDRFTEAQRLEVRNHLARIRRSIPRLGLVEVYTVGGLGQPLQQPVLHMCNPGTGKDLNRLYQNPELAYRRWLSFDDSVSTTLVRQMSGSASPASPIFEAIQAVAVRLFGLPEYDGVPKHLVVVSDLLQNVPGALNMYETLPSFSAFKGSTYFTQVGADLRDVMVTVYYLARPGSRTQGRTHAEFWNQYFLAQGATVETLTKVYGAE